MIKKIKNYFNNGAAMFNVNIQIYKCVLDRIKKNIQYSNVEEGGKLLGNVVVKHNRIDILIESYIDSGPNVDNSSSHLHPDGYYQEALFRVIERFDENIEHIGSWHSHHCNGLDELSHGDINGYFSSVNNPNYNLDIFFSLLITRLSTLGLQYKSFLFVRHKYSYSEIPTDSIKLVPGRYKYDDMLVSAEKLALGKRRISNVTQHSNDNTYEAKQQLVTLPFFKPLPGFTRNSQPYSRHETKNDTLEKTIRIEDNNWFKENCRFVVTKKDKREGTLFWEWKIFEGNNCLTFKYIHPKKISDTSFNYALIKASIKEKMLFEEKILLNPKRHLTMSTCIEKAKKIFLQQIENDK